MISSEIRFHNGKPLISVNGELHYPIAYTTYFDECGEFTDFIKSGYKMFFVNVSFTDLPINNTTGFTPFRTGVFENEVPDYSEFENTVYKILSECPDALIFPRIYISMPRKWIKANNSETVKTEKGGNRESLHSDAFRRCGADLLKKLVSHIRSSDYAENIVGYQLCGGLTQEWMHHDFSGSFSQTGLEKFRKWAKEKYGITEIPHFEEDALYSKEFEKYISKYGEFCCESAAETVNYFSGILKEYISHEQIVGVFYGYNAFVNNYLSGLHGLRFIIDSPHIDFFSSPCCYDDNRKLGIDWGDMVTAASLKYHGKLYFVECDIRTHLTRQMQDSRPGLYPDNIYTLTDENGNKTAWCGPETKELSLSAIRKAFAHQLTKGSGIWWFDMWGGWYHDSEIMSEIKEMKIIADKSTGKVANSFPCAETVMFIDEKAYLNNPIGSHLCHSVNITRIEMGNTGIPFDLCMVEDAEKVIHRYRAAIFTAPIPSEDGKHAVKKCEELDIPFISTNTEKSYYTKNELRNFLTQNGVHCYNDDGSVIYCGEGFIGIHAHDDGNFKISLPEKFRITPVFADKNYENETDMLDVNMKKHETFIWEFKEAKTDKS